MVGIKLSSARTQTRIDDWPTKVLAEALALAYVSSAAIANAEQPALLTHSAPAPRQLAQAGDTRQAFNIPPQPLDSALIKVAAGTGLQLNYSGSIVRGLRTTGVAGTYTPEQALRILLDGTGLTYRFSNSNTVTLVRAAPAEGPKRLAPITVPLAAGGEGSAQLAPITVEGVGYAGQFEVEEGFKAEYQTTATKMPVPLRETPQSVSVITQDSLEARQVTDLGQALETAAGVNLYSGTGPFAGQDFGLGAIQIRGFDTDFLTDIRQDGFVSPIFAAQPDLAPYERIEVVKGPSSLYGRGSASGFINRVTKKPLPFFRADAEGSVGSFDFYRAEGDVSGPLLGSERARGRLILAYQDAGSFVDGLESERVVVAPSLEFDLTDSTRLLLQGNYQDDEFIISPGLPLQQDGENFVAPDIRRSLFVGVPTEDESTTEIVTASAQLEQRLGERWLATLRLNHSSTKHRSQTDNYASGIEPNGDVGLYSSAFRIDNDVWAGELRLERSLDLLGRPATVVLGVDHADVQNINDQFFGVLDAPGGDTANIYEENFADFPTVEPQRSFTGVFEQPSTGGYAQLQFRPLDRLSVLLGGRYDSADTSNEEQVGATSSERDDDDFTGRAGLVFDVTDNTSAYALYAQSFQPALFDVDANGQLLEPEEGEIYEGGVKSVLLDGRLGVNAAIFRIERDSVPITVDTLPGATPFSIPDGVQRSDGVELEVNGEPLPGWNLSVAGSLLDSEFIEGDPDTIGNSNTGVADWQLGLYSSYELQGGPLRGLGLGAGLFAIDDRAVTATESGTLDGYERVDLSAFYNGFKPFKVGLQVRNVLDEKYVEGADRTSSYAQFGSPTAALLTVEYEFGD